MNNRDQTQISSAAALPAGTADEVYEDAIKIWLVRNNRDLIRLRNKGRHRSEAEIVAQIKDVEFGANDGWRYSELTPGPDAEPIITFKYRGSYREHPLQWLPMGIFIREVSAIVTENTQH